MKKLVTIIATLAFVAGLAACSGPYTSFKTNRMNLPQVSVGMTEAQVVEIMGAPTYKDQVMFSGFQRTTYYYFTNELGNKGFTSSVSHWNVTREDCMPLVFKDGVLVASGRYEKLYY